MPLPTYQNSECERQQRVEDIRKRAYVLWEQAGRPHGRDKEFWLTAEAEYNECDELPRPRSRCSTARAAAKTTPRTR